MIRDGKLGGDLVVMDDLNSPKVKDIERNCLLLAPLAKLSPAKVPSGFLAADGILKLDNKLAGKLLNVEASQREAKAVQEGYKLKVLMQKCRQLFRKQPLPSRTRSVKLAHLKQLLTRWGTYNHAVLL